MVLLNIENFTPSVYEGNFKETKHYFNCFFKKKARFYKKPLFLSLINQYLIQTSMRLEKYEAKANKTKTIFTFTSKGPKGNIIKIVLYSKMKVKGFKNVYNLAFGDKLLNSNDFDDTIITDNQDREKVLATVVNTVIIFSNRHPEAQIYFEGSNDARIRLYNMVISKYFGELSEIFEIKGVSDRKLLPFDKNINFSSFLIRRKIS